MFFSRHSIFVFFTPIILQHVISASAEEVKVDVSQRQGREKQCSWPGKRLLRPDFVPIRKSEDGTIILVVSANSLKEWKRCVGQISKETARMMLQKLRQKFLDVEGGKEILEMSDCSPKEILEIFDVNATRRQARKAAQCLLSVFKEQDSGSDISEVVRINEDCERERNNKIREATAKVTARMAVTAAAGVCCGAGNSIGIPASGGVSAVWCSIFVDLVALSLEAEAELFAASNMECPESSDEEVSRILDDDEVKYRKRHLARYLTYAVNTKSSE